jgi:hypothetical protein
MLIQTAIAVLLAFIVHEYFDALPELPCGTPGAGRGCYPWGGEGPAAGGWNYGNKEIYLRSVIGAGIVCAAAILAPFFARGRWTGIIAMAGIVVVGGKLVLPWLLGG